MDLFDLFAKISLDPSDYYNKLGEAGDKTNAFADKFKTGLATAAKVGGAAIAAAGAGIASMTKQSIDNFSQFEQLVGGVETLFKDSSDTVQQYAQNAYKTAGMSSNEYMETVTSFSASLLQSLGGDTAAAAEKANQAITDMADNANKMGSTTESIQNAYNGFAKQNFTMLDNLKLGYGGTKEEMQRLLDDAEKLSGIEYDISSYSDIVDAIHVVQTEMGITGTTAAEASSTITGSLDSMKAAWQNVLTGIADENQDLSVLVENLADSAVIAANNIAPRIAQVLEGVGVIGEKIAPLIANGITAAVEKAPEFLNAATGMLSALGNALLEQKDLLIQNAFDLILVLTDGLIQGVGSLADGALQMVESLALWVEEYSDVLAEKAYTLLISLVESVIENLPELAVAALKIMGALATGVIEYVPELIKKVPEIISELVDGFAEAMPDIIAVGEDIVRGLWEGISNLAGWIGEKVSGFFDGLFDDVKKHEEIHSPSKKWAFIGRNDALGIGAGWGEAFPDVKKRMLSGLDFSTASIDFASSGFGVSSAGIINATAGDRSRGNGGNSFELILKSEEGQTFGRWMVPFIRSEDKSNPGVVSDAWA